MLYMTKDYIANYKPLYMQLIRKGTRDLPDMYYVCPIAKAIHVRQIKSVHTMLQLIAITSMQYSCMVER